MARRCAKEDNDINENAHDEMADADEQTRTENQTCLILMATHTNEYTNMQK